MNIPAISLSTNIHIPTTIPAKNISRPNHHHPQQSKPSPPPPPTPLKTIKTLTKSNQLDEAFTLLQTTQPPSTSPYSTFLSTCISQNSILHGQKLYLHLLLNNPTTLLHHPIILSKFITLFSTSPQNLQEANLILQHALYTSPNNSVDELVWSALALGYINNGYKEKALFLYTQMLARRVSISSSTLSLFVDALAGIRDLGFAKSVHGQIIKSGLEPDGGIYDVLLGLYNELGGFEEVFKVFETMPKRDNTLLVKFVEKGMMFEAFEVFRKMCFDWDSLVAVLSGCGCMGLVNVAKEIHVRMVKSNGDDINAVNMLLDVYGKCGEVEYCRRVFDDMRVKDLMSWNNVLNGYAINGCSGEMTGLFEEMVECGIRPDGLTFRALLTGCSYSGFVEGGQEVFDRMRKEFRIEPDLEHYACLVDMYGKIGRIEEALEMVKLMPMEPSEAIYGSLLNSCRQHGNVSLAEEIFEQILELGPNYFKNYIIMSNIYSDVGMREGVDRVRGIMEERRIQSVDMCSWIQIKDQVYMFMESERSKFRNSDEFKKLWDDLHERVDREEMFRASVENVKAGRVCGHSERVATVFGLIHCAPGIPIRITNNSIVCKACHSWMKNVSKLTRRKIILRDTYQIHHFHEGKCRCNENW